MLLKDLQPNSYKIVKHPNSSTYDVYVDNEVIISSTTLLGAIQGLFHHYA